VTAERKRSANKSKKRKKSGGRGDGAPRKGEGGSETRGLVEHQGKKKCLAIGFGEEHGRHPCRGEIT